MVISRLTPAGGDEFLKLGHAPVHVFHGSRQVLSQVVNLTAEGVPYVLVRFSRRLQGPKAVVQELKSNQSVPTGIRGAGCVGDSLVKAGDVIGEGRQGCLLLLDLGAERLHGQTR